METLEQRRDHTIELRTGAAEHYRTLPLPAHINNGDEGRFANENYFASFTKGLPHSGPLGEVDAAAYRTLLSALDSGKPADFNIVPQGWPDPTRRRGFVDPQAGLAFDLEGIDSHLLTMPPCYPFASEGSIGEIAEVYWQALARDVAFVDYGTGAGTDKYAVGPGSPTNDAAADLSKYLVFDGPKAGGNVTKDTLFRGLPAGALTGPYVSQFLLLDVPYGAESFAQKMTFALPDKDYMVDPAEWLNVQSGFNPGIGPTFAPKPKYLYRGRDLAQYVHIDELFQAYLNACLLLISPNGRGGLNAPLNPGNPYPLSDQDGFGTLGEPNFKVLVAQVATQALKAVWFQKWFVHRRARPETFAGRLHHRLVGTAGANKYPFHAGELAKLNATLMPKVKAHNAPLIGGGTSYLLPMAFPEGSPIHPAYGAGHATVAGACVTVLKALFKSEEPIAPLIAQAQKAGGGTWTVTQPRNDGSALDPYAGNVAEMTVGSELDKLAANVGIARDFAGVHWRSDYTESLRLGEQVALNFLRETLMTYNEDAYFEVPLLDGTILTITKP